MFATVFSLFITMLQGVLETFGGIGFAAGPPLGGILFEFGGFILPFTILGILLLIAGALSYFMLPSLKGVLIDNRETVNWR
jgi:MFS family permease